MMEYRLISIQVGVLFIVATVLAVIGFVFWMPLEEASYPLTIDLSGQQILLGVLCLIVTAFAVIFIPVAIFPVLQQHNLVLAVAYVVLRSIEAVFLFVLALVVLLILLLAQEPPGVGDSSVFLLLGNLYDWSLWLATTLVLGVSGVVLNYLLVKHELVPKWISLWGLTASVLLVLAGCLALFSYQIPLLWVNPFFAMGEMVFAVFLLMKGFKRFEPDALAI